MIDKKIRILQALLFNWYRERVAIDNNIFPFKPVVLFRSKTIIESENDYNEFLNLVENLSVNDFKFLEEIENAILEDISLYQRGKSIIKKIINYIKKRNIKYQEIVKFIQDNFKQKNCIITNSKEKIAKGKRGGEKTTPEQEALLNSLEDKNNHIRAIFTVQRLTEGWDTLNLYDIVRLYQGRDNGKDSKTGKSKAGKTTTSEIQLIGRGVRYYPFFYNNLEKNKRKFDGDLDNDLRVLEELYYHSDSDHRYLDELKRELKNEGYIQDNRIAKEFKLKKEFTSSDFFKEIKLFKNEQIQNPDRKKKSLSEIIKDITIEKEIKSYYSKEEHVNLNNGEKDDTLSHSKNVDSQTVIVTISQMINIHYEKHILLKAINSLSRQENSFFQFRNIVEELDIKTIEELFSENFIGNLKITYFVSQDRIEKYKNDLGINKVSSEDVYYCISHEEKLSVIIASFKKISLKIKEYSNPYKGTEFKNVTFKEIFDKPKIKNVVWTDEIERLERNFIEKDWYILDGFIGTDEEKLLGEFLSNHMLNFQNKYEKVYLLRNEEILDIFSFEEGKRFYPDFLMFLKSKNENTYYQIFIEPKGSQFLDSNEKFKNSKEAWKEEFLIQISKKYGDNNLLKIENEQYKLYGLPLFNNHHKDKFEEEINKFY